MIDEFFVHTASVETYLGHTSAGDQFDVAVDKAGFMDDERKVILAADGQTVVSGSTWYTALADADLYPLKSKVTVNGRTATVLGVKRRDGGSLDLPDHLEVDLT